VVTRSTNRKDHYLPQGYLRGFIDPTRRRHPRPLWHFEIPQNRWSERSPKEVAYRHGLYDYANAPADAESADAAFRELELSYPRIRERLIARNFENWPAHRDLLLRFFQMMRARSLLFLDRIHRAGKDLRTFVAEDISADRRSVKVESLTPSPPPETFVKNWAITMMRAEIQKGPDWLNEVHWMLMRTRSSADPFIIGETPTLATGPCATIEEAATHPETLFLFPLCWQACLIGSRQAFGVETHDPAPEELLKIRRVYRDSSSLFLVSPRRLDDL
jgi:hypothetical protein